MEGFGLEMPRFDHTDNGRGREKENKRTPPQRNGNGGFFLKQAETTQAVLVATVEAAAAVAP